MSNKYKEIKVLDKGFVRLVEHMGDDSSIVQMARVSYGDGTKTVNKDRGLIRYLIRNAHTSPLEGVTFKFHVRAPIFIFRQWHRHRTWSFNEMSGRYSVMPEDCYVPDYDDVTKQDPNNKQGGTDNLVTSEEDIDFPASFEDMQNAIRGQYNEFVETGMRRELARINLPLSQYSEMYAVVDLHNLFHFLRLRLDSHAQYEIRLYAQALYDSIKPIVPYACEAFEDYILNSVKLNPTEQKCLIEIIDIFRTSLPIKGSRLSNDSGGWNTKLIVEEAVKRNISNKREQREAISKIEKFLPHG